MPRGQRVRCASRAWCCGALITFCWPGRRHERARAPPALLRRATRGRAAGASPASPASAESAARCAALAANGAPARVARSASQLYLQAPSASASASASASQQASPQTGAQRNTARPASGRISLSSMTVLMTPAACSACTTCAAREFPAASRTAAPDFCSGRRHCCHRGRGTAAARAEEVTLTTQRTTRGARKVLWTASTRSRRRAPPSTDAARRVCPAISQTSCGGAGSWG